MRVERIQYKNFGSYGNKMMVLEFPDQPSFFQVHGKNGGGKSTISDVIKFGIYGRLEKKKLKDISNRLNKGTYVCVELTVNRGKVKIERGIDPGFFRLYLNGKEVDKAGKRSVQEFLEEELIEMPFYVFCNTLSLSINDFKSFLKMSSGDKKAIIDKIFGLSVLNEMRELIKIQTKKLKDSISNLTVSVNAYQRTYDKTEAEIQLLEARIVDSNEDKVKHLQQSFAHCKTNIDTVKLNLSKIRAKETEFSGKRKEIYDAIASDRLIIRECDHKIHLYENSKCPTCESDLTTDFHKEISNQHHKTKTESKKRILSRDSSMSKIDAALSQLSTLKDSSLKQLHTLEAKLDITSKELSALQVKEVSNEESSSMRKILEESKKSIEEARTEQSKSQNAISYYSLVEEILGEKGVKQMAIRTILPSLNSEIGKLVKLLGVDYKIVFDEEFNAKITHFGIEISPETLSGGEETKVDFAVLLAVVRLMKLKYPQMNTFFLDEIFAKIDGDGQYHILKILKDVVKDYKMNIFIISQYPLEQSSFDYMIAVEKNKGYSTFTCNKVA